MRKILCVYNEVPSGAASIHQRRKNQAGRSMPCQLVLYSLGIPYMGFSPSYSLHQPAASRNASTSALPSCVVYT